MQSAGGISKTNEWIEFNEAMLAVLNSPRYRKRFIEEIKNDFPGIPPLTQPALRQKLAHLGKRLICAQLLKAEVPESAFCFRGTLGEKIQSPELVENSLRISDSGFFEGVEPSVYEFNLAGYQVCKNWVNAGNKSGIQRKGTALTSCQAQLFRRVLFGISESITARTLVDKILMEQLGW